MHKNKELINKIDFEDRKEICFTIDELRNTKLFHRNEITNYIIDFVVSNYGNYFIGMYDNNKTVFELFLKNNYNSDDTASNEEDNRDEFYQEIKNKQQ